MIHAHGLGVLMKLLLVAVIAALAIACTGDAQDDSGESPDAPRIVAARLVQLLEVYRTSAIEDSALEQTRALLAADQFRAVCDDPALPADLSSPCSNGLLAIEHGGSAAAPYGVAFDGLYEVVSRADVAALNDEYQHDPSIAAAPEISPALLAAGRDLIRAIGPSPMFEPDRIEGIQNAANAVRNACRQPAPGELIGCVFAVQAVDEFSEGIATVEDLQVDCGHGCVADSGAYQPRKTRLLEALSTIGIR